MGTYIAGVAPFEASLIERVKRDEEGAFQELFSLFRPKIFRTALRILKEEKSAEDATQETFLNVFRAARKFRGDSKVGTWINRIAVNVCLEILRKNKKHQWRDDVDISQQHQLPDHRAVSPFETARQREVRRRVRGAIARLGPKHSYVVQRHDLEGFTIKEIAAQLQVAEGTVKSRLFYGREELKRRLAG